MASALFLLWYYTSPGTFDDVTGQRREVFQLPSQELPTAKT